jgi:3-hydroxy acid dehydrogenase/malonic semialdehyde reductase
VKVMDSFRLDGQVAFVTGGARTLGYDMAEALAEAGCHLAITSREQAHAERAAKTLKDAYHVDVLPLALDVRVYDQVAATVKQAQQWKGRIDVLINNAGGALGLDPAHKARLEDWDQMVAVNVSGMMHMTRALLPGMV